MRQEAGKSVKDVTVPSANDFGSQPSNQFASPPSPNDFAAVKDFTAGVAAGVALVVTGHPFDTVKVKLQASNVSNGASSASQASLGAPRYRSAWQCTSHILRTEGIPGLYRGATSSFIGVAVESSLLFGSYTQIKTALQNGERSAPTAGTVAAAAGLAGGLISFVLCPTELVKCRLQVQAQSPALSPAASVYTAAAAAATAGAAPTAAAAAGASKGLAATALRESLGNIGFFLTYEAIKHRLLPALAPSSPSHSSSAASSSSASSDLSVEIVQEGSSQVRQGLRRRDLAEGRGGEGEGVSGGREAVGTGGANEWQRVAAEAATAIASGGIAGIVFWSAVLPFDVIKTRIQTADASASPESLRMLSQCKAVSALINLDTWLMALFAALACCLSLSLPCLGQ
ncbi:unnamed protein product [Closterium sp. Naga37s-1]|nr:unnamed protein product [Closterium sp. Naga37s-1]